MKNLVIVALLLTACGTVPKFEVQWDLRSLSKEEKAQFYTDQNQCADYAFKSKVAGSRWPEYKINDECLKRKGYKTFTTQVN